MKAPLAALALFLCVGCAGTRPPAADIKPGSLISRTVKVDDHGTPVERTFAIWIPPGYTAAREWPCVVFLNGSGECGTDGVKQTKVGLLPAARADPEQWPCIIVLPQKPEMKPQWEEYDELVMASLKAARDELRVDKNRISLTGLSQGGHGAWVLGAKHHDVWSAVVPICGYGPADVEGLARLPVWAFHGEQDSAVPVVQSVNLTAEAKHAWQNAGEHGSGPKLTLYPDLNHNCWDRAYRDEHLGHWLLSQKRR